MIYYNQWLGQDATLIAGQSRQNEMSAARFYAGLSPLRTAIQWIGALTSPMWRSMRARLRRRAALRELQGLDDRLLRDVGLTRGQIDELARSSFGRDMVHRIALRGGRPLLGLSRAKDKPACDVIALAPRRRARDAQAHHGKKQTRRSGSLDAA